MVLALFLIEDRAQSKDIQVKTQINEHTFYLHFELKTQIYEENPIERNFHGSQEKISGEEDRFHLPPMGFLPSETRLEIFFDFELISCPNKEI